MSTMTPTQFATEVESTGREVRKFLRSVTPKDAHPGKGSRWELPASKREVNKLKKQFASWVADSEAKKAEKVAPAEVEEIEDEEPTVEALDDIEVEDEN